MSDYYKQSLDCLFVKAKNILKWKIDHSFFETIEYMADTDKTHISLKRSMSFQCTRSYAEISIIISSFEEEFVTQSNYKYDCNSDCEYELNLIFDCTWHIVSVNNIHKLKIIYTLIKDENKLFSYLLKYHKQSDDNVITICIPKVILYLMGEKMLEKIPDYEIISFNRSSGILKIVSNAGCVII